MPVRRGRELTSQRNGWHNHRTMRKFRDYLTSASRTPFLLWRARGEKGSLEVVFKNGLRLALRGQTNDYHTAMEIFCADQYVFPETVTLENVRQIVDVGANVGYSLLYFAHTFPEARITAFEPHPQHIAQIHQHLRANRLQDRITLIEAAAGTEPTTAFLYDEGAGSAVQSQGGGSRTLPIPIVDWFDHLPTGAIDLLKMDIEGAEYPLLSDPRFPAVAARTRCIVLEWHRSVVMEYHCPEKSGGDPRVTITDGHDWCTKRLRGLGFEILEGAVQYGSAGTFWAYRPDRHAADSNKQATAPQMQESFSAAQRRS